MKHSTYLEKRLAYLKATRARGVVGRENMARLQGQIQQVERDLRRARADESEQQQPLELN